MRLFAISSVAIICLAIPAIAQDKAVRTLNPTLQLETEARQKPEVRPEPTVKSQTDLDTLQLASAHREQAESMREKTNGLWQSWLVSICEGCGPERTPYFKRRTQLSHKSLEKVSPALTAQQAAPKAVESKAVASPVASRRNIASIYEDLSDSCIDEIRRAPTQ